MKTEQTVRHYRIRAQQLIKRVEHDIGSNQPTLYEMAQWLVEKQAAISKATWRQYRAAMICYLEDELSPSADGQRAIALLRATDTRQCKSHGTQTSAKKLKKISLADLQKLVAYFLVRETTRYGTETLAWLLSGLWTGLRPAEWQSAQFVKNNQGEWALSVQNAKNTNGRSHGDERIIHLSNISPLEIKVIRLHLTHIKSAENNDIRFHAFYHHCRDCLYQANQKLWPNRPKFISLYSARHQFAADAKKSGLDKSSIAALMGHASIETAGIHYGRRVSGRGGLKVSAHPGDVETVRALNVDRPKPASPGHGLG
jgi:integrase